MNMVCDAAGTRLFYREAGTGAPVVLLHGFAATGAQWKATVAGLRNRHSVIVPDLPGYGGSQITREDGTPTLAPQIGAIAALIERIGRPVHLAGHGFGASIAAGLALAQPDQVASLSLIEPCLLHLLRNGRPRDQARYLDICAIEAQLQAATQNGDPHAGMGAFFDHWNGAGSWYGLSASTRDVYAADGQQVVRDIAACRDQSWSLDDVRGINCPVLACMGSHAHPVTRRATEMITDAAPLACLKVVPGAGHMLPASHPETVSAALARHFALTVPAGQTVPATAAKVA
jgi:pimeloyl-ACP methyl ester carboxylesterase